MADSVAVGGEEVDSGKASDGGSWVDSALDWAIVTMHYLAQTTGTDFTSEGEVSSNLESLERHSQSHPEPKLPVDPQSTEAEPEDEVDGLIHNVVNLVHNTVDCLRVRRERLQKQAADTQAGASSAGQVAGDDSPAEGSAIDLDTSVPARSDMVSPDVDESTLVGAGPGDWLPFPTKRPSQMDLHNWMSAFRSNYQTGHVAGQFKRQRLDSTREVARFDEAVDTTSSTTEGDESLMVDETDTAPDKGAYLVMMRKRQELAAELVESEKRYVDDLEAVLKNYYEGYDYGSLANVPGGIRGKKNIIFGNLKKILEFNKTLFLPALETVQKTPLKVGQTFMDNERDLGLYSLYFKNMPAQEELLQENLQFFRSIQIRLNDPFAFQSYLIKPMQRMTKYKQFLESFQNYTPKTEKMETFHEEIANALWLVQFQLRHGNDLLALDRLKGFAGNPAEQGLLLRQGDFHTQDKKGRHERRVFLFEEMLLLCKKQKAGKGSKEVTYVFKESYKVCDMGIVENIDGHPGKFELYFKRHNTKDSVFLTPLTSDQQAAADVHREWVKDVQHLLWQQFKRVKERMENLRSGVEASMFGNKRASTIYGDVGMYGGDRAGSIGARGPSVVSGDSKEAAGSRGSTQTSTSGGGYAVPTGVMQRTASIRKPGQPVNISSPVPVQPAPTAPTAPTLYAVSGPVVIGSAGQLDPKDLPPPTMPPPPVPSTETSASSGNVPPPLPPRVPMAAQPPRTAPPCVPNPSEYLTPEDSGEREAPPPRPPLPLDSVEEPAGKQLVSPTRAPPPPPPGRQPPPVPEPQDAGFIDEDNDDPIYDDVTSSDEFSNGDDDEFGASASKDPDRLSTATEYEEIDGKRQKKRS